MVMKQSSRLGRVSVTKFENTTKDREGNPSTFDTFLVEKNYVVKEDGKDVWKNTNSFSYEELQQLVVVLHRVLGYRVVDRGSTQGQE